MKSREATQDSNLLDLQVAEDETLREKTIKVLREAIVNQHFAPGQRLLEKDLCEQTGVSRTSVREALRHLQAEGLVETHGTRGVFVTMLTFEVAMEIYEIRAALESEAAFHFAARASDEQLAQLDEIFREIERLATRDNESYREASGRFFELLLQGAGNRTADQMMRLLRARISYLRAHTIRLSTPDRLRDSVQQLQTLMEALRVRDGAAAAKACRETVSRSARFAAEVLEHRAA